MCYISTTVRKGGQILCRERTDASDFNAALYEHTQYLRRKKEASEMREAYTASVEDSNGTASTSQTDMSLKPGETITLKLARARLCSHHCSALHK